MIPEKYFASLARDDVEDSVKKWSKKKEIHYTQANIEFTIL